MTDSQRNNSAINQKHQTTMEDIEITSQVRPIRQLSTKHQYSLVKNILFRIAIFLIVLIAVAIIGNQAFALHSDVGNVLFKQDSALLKLDQAAQQNQNLHNQLENISKAIQDIKQSTNTSSFIQTNVPINPVPTQSTEIAQLQHLLNQKQQTIAKLINQLDQVKKYQQSSLQNILTQIQIKRRNQNMLRTMMSATYIKFQQSGHYYDTNLMNLLIDFYTSKTPQSIADFGCGKCQYIINLYEKGYNAQGYDGTPFSNKSIIKQMDLSQRVNLEQTYDYVQSFEVGEHIFSDFEDNFIYNIAQHAKKGILLSWSIVGQGGYMHVNNRDNSYVIQKIQKYGFKFNPQQTQRFRQVLQNWFHNTLMIFDKINPP